MTEVLEQSPAPRGHSHCAKTKMIAELLARDVTRLVRRNPFAAEPRFAQLDVQPHLFVELGLRPAAADEQAKPPEDLSDSRHRYFSGLSMVTLFAARARSRR